MKLKRILGLVSVVILALFSSMAFAACEETDPGEYEIQESGQHYIYMTFGTLPTLYATMHMYTHNHPSYIYFGRAKTYDVTKVPEYVTPFENQATPNASPSPASVVAEARNVVKRIIENSEDNVKIHFYVDDLRVLLAYDALLSNGLKEDDFTITLLSDGTGSYNSFDAYKEANDGDVKWIAENQNFETYLEKFADGTSTLTPAQLLFFVGGGNDIGQLYPTIAAQRSNVEYWVQFPEYFSQRTDISGNIKNEMLKSNLVKLQPINMINKLDAGKFDAFIDAFLNTNQEGYIMDKNALDSMMDPMGKPEGTLIISGTSVTGEKNLDFATTLDKIIDDFGTDYRLVYKPHPVHAPTGDRLDMFESRNITVLPAQTPAELLMFAYPDAVIGGFNSSLYMGVDSTRVKFFIGNLEPFLNWLDNSDWFSDSVERYTLA